MLLHKATIYFFNINNDDALDNLEFALDRSDVNAKLFDKESVEIGEWYDDIPLNYSKCTKGTYETFFSFDNELINKMVKDYKCLQKTKKYTQYSDEEIKPMVINCYRRLNDTELQHFLGQIEEIGE